MGRTAARVSRAWSTRPFRIADAEELSRLHRDAMAPLGQRGWSGREIAALAGGRGCFALVIDEADGGQTELLGFVLARTVAEEAELLTLAVAPAAQRRGIGRSLLEEAAAEAAAAGAQRLLLEVSVDNVAAIALYERAGFVGLGVRRGYYGRCDGDRVDALVLARPL